MTIRNLLTTAALGAALLASTAVSAITYTVNLVVGPGSVTGTIDTDGTLGVLGTGNITDWSLLLDDGVSTFLLDGFANSAVIVVGDQFTATSAGIFFNFSHAGDFAAVDFQNPFIGSGINYFCLNDASGGCSGNPSAIGLRVEGDLLGAAQEGVTLIGSAAVIPEPATWGLMIAGFGLTGFAMRHRKAALAA